MFCLPISTFLYLWGRPILGIYKSLTDTHECRKWEPVRAVSFMGIHKSDFRYSVAVSIGIYIEKKESSAVLTLAGPPPCNLHDRMSPNAIASVPIWLGWGGGGDSYPTCRAWPTACNAGSSSTKFHRGSSNSSMFSNPLFPIPWKSKNVGALVLPCWGVRTRLTSLPSRKLLTGMLHRGHSLIVFSCIDMSLPRSWSAMRLCLIALLLCCYVCH